jgi:hypothetical protein
MEVALAEMAFDDVKDVEDDNDFVNDKGAVIRLTLFVVISYFITVEEDIFGSDFESTDDEAEKVGEAGENEVIYEERRIRKVRQAGFLI